METVEELIVALETTYGLNRIAPAQRAAAMLRIQAAELEVLRQQVTELEMQLDSLESPCR
jgi:hypothetical protein